MYSIVDSTLSLDDTFFTVNFTEGNVDSDAIVMEPVEQPLIEDEIAKIEEDMASKEQPIVEIEEDLANDQAVIAKPIVNLGSSGHILHVKKSLVPVKKVMNKTISSARKNIIILLALLMILLLALMLVLRM